MIMSDQVVTAGGSKMTAFEISLLGVLFFYHHSLTGFCGQFGFGQCVDPSWRTVGPWVTAAGAGTGAANFLG